MKTLNKIFILILFAILVVAGYAAAQYVISPSKDVTVQDWILTLDVNATLCVKGDPLLFNGRLSSNGFVYEGATVTLYCNGENTGLSDLTNSTGYYEIVYSPMTVGVLTFYANATMS